MRSHHDTLPLAFLRQPSLCRTGKGKQTGKDCHWIATTWSMTKDTRTDSFHCFSSCHEGLSILFTLESLVSLFTPEGCLLLPVGVLSVGTTCCFGEGSDVKTDEGQAYDVGPANLVRTSWSGLLPSGVASGTGTHVHERKASFSGTFQSNNTGI